MSNRWLKSSPLPMKWLEWRELPVENTSTQRTLSTQRNLFGIYTKTLMTQSEESESQERLWGGIPDSHPNPGIIEW